MISSVLLAVAGSQCAISLVHWGATVLARPRILPRMDFSGGVPEGHRTIVAVPAMLTDDRETDELLDAMEVRFLANRDENILFALLTDFPDASEEKLPDDEARLLHARERINALNQKYSGFNGNGNGDLTGHSDTEVDAEKQELGNDGIPGAFYLFHRPRRWNRAGKRLDGLGAQAGKLEELNLALRGDTRGFATIIGPRDRLTDVKYVLTLDSDTQLPREAVRLLIGTMAHPLNRPHYDAKRGRVTDGYGILQPRVGISMPSARRSRFAQLFAGEPGIDPYTQAVSDVYQDLFEEGSFIGKGIYDIDTVQKSMGENSPKIASSATICSKGPTHAPDWSATSCCLKIFPRPIRRISAAAIAGFAATGRFPAGCCHGFQVRRRDLRPTRYRRCRSGKYLTISAGALSRSRCWGFCSSAGSSRRVRFCTRWL